MPHQPCFFSHALTSILSALHRPGQRGWILFSIILLIDVAHAAADLPVEWIDPDTGHRIVRLSREDGSTSLYFHQNAYSADGKKLIMTSPGGLCTVDLATRAIDQVVPGRVGVLVTGRKTGDVYYVRDSTVFATNLDTHVTREITQVPPAVEPGGNLTVNADETLLVGLGVDPKGQAEPRALPPDDAGGRLGLRWAEGRPMVLFTIDLKTGEFRRLHASHDWLNHLQCSPTDPGLIMFCHEGPWHFNDRIWTIRTDGTGLRLMHRRTMEQEIAGHEFFSRDGKTVWYDLQTPKSGVFWVAGVNFETGERTWFNLQRVEWSVHYNVSPDGTLFAGDGGGPASVASRTPDGQTLSPPGHGQWIYLFRPVLAPNATRQLSGQKDLIRTGYFRAERLVNLAKHDYRLEPNVTFTPDARWIVFRSNMLGPTHVFAVEIRPAHN
jgi:oligogalacturonide lyase